MDTPVEVGMPVRCRTDTDSEHPTMAVFWIDHTPTTPVAYCLSPLWDEPRRIPVDQLQVDLSGPAILHALHQLGYTLGEAAPRLSDMIGGISRPGGGWNHATPEQYQRLLWQLSKYVTQDAQHRLGQFAAHIPELAGTHWSPPAATQAIQEIRAQTLEHILEQRGHHTPRFTPPTVDQIAQAIRRADGHHTLGAAALAEAIHQQLQIVGTQEPDPEMDPNNRQLFIGGPRDGQTWVCVPGQRAIRVAFPTTLPDLLAPGSGLEPWDSGTPLVVYTWRNFGAADPITGVAAYRGVYAESHMSNDQAQQRLSEYLLRHWVMRQTPEDTGDSPLHTPDTGGWQIR